MSEAADSKYFLIFLIFAFLAQLVRKGSQISLISVRFYLFISDFIDYRVLFNNMKRAVNARPAGSVSVPDTCR
jgi:hypothetical protein